MPNWDIWNRLLNVPLLCSSMISPPFYITPVWKEYTLLPGKASWYSSLERKLYLLPLSNLTRAYNTCTSETYFISCKINSAFGMKDFSIFLGFLSVEILPFLGVEVKITSWHLLFLNFYLVIGIIIIYNCFIFLSALPVDLLQYCSMCRYSDSFKGTWRQLACQTSWYNVLCTSISSWCGKNWSNIHAYFISCKRGSVAEWFKVLVL